MRDPLTTMVLATVGFFVGIVVLLVGYRGTRTSAGFIDTYSAKLWVVLIGVQTAFWAVAFRPLWSGLRRFSRDFKEELRGSVPRIVAFDVLFLALLFTPPRISRYPVATPLLGHEWKLVLITLIGAIVIGIPALTGMFEVRVVSQAALRASGRDLTDLMYLTLRDNLQRFLRIAGAAIALATLATGALRQAMLAYGAAATSFPASVVLQYGLFLTILLSLAYVPAFLSLRTAGRELAERLLPMPALAGPTWFEWNARRKVLDEFLQLDESMFDRLQASLFILAPLLTAALSLAIPQGQS